MVEYHYKTNKKIKLHFFFSGVIDVDLSEIQGHEKFRQRFKDGLILCRLMNKLSPKIIEKYCKNPKQPFQQMENLEFVNHAMRDYGVQSEYIFVTTDLHQGRNLYTVQLCLRCLGDKATAKGFTPAFKL